MSQDSKGGRVWLCGVDRGGTWSCFLFGSVTGTFVFRLDQAARTEKGYFLASLITVIIFVEQACEFRKSTASQDDQLETQFVLHVCLFN